MAKGRPTFSFYLIDLPSDHEIDDSLVTECQVITAILHNRSFKSVTKTERISSAERFRETKWRSYSGLGYVHLAGHGSKKGVELIGGRISWQDVAGALKKIAPKLRNDQKRILTLSCCYSPYATNSLSPLIKGHFTGIYFFNDNEIFFADTMTAFAMFYRRKTMRRPHKAILERINGFFEKDLLAFDAV